MKTERFEYQNKDLPLLRKDIFMRLLFMGLFMAVFVWAFVNIVVNYMRDELSVIKTIVGVVILVISLLFALISLVYAFRSFNTKQKVVLNGNAVKNITIISNIKKNSFLRIYSFVMQLISIVMLMVLACGITYAVLEYVYFTTLSYYLPILFLVSITGFNSVYHIKAEIKTIQNVQEFNSIF